MEKNGGFLGGRFFFGHEGGGGALKDKRLSPPCRPKKGPVRDRGGGSI